MLKVAVVHKVLSVHKEQVGLFSTKTKYNNVISITLNCFDSSGPPPGAASTTTGFTCATRLIHIIKMDIRPNSHCLRTWH